MHQHIGISLIELLISLMLISIIMLGMDALQVSAIQQTRSAYYFAVAQQQMSVITTQLKIIKNNGYHELLNAWNIQNQAVLPQGKGIITGNYPNYKIIIIWGNMDEGNCRNTIIGTKGCLQEFL